MKYEGVALGEDVIVAQAKGRNVKRMDFSFLEYPDNHVDMIFARHALEHSPMPLITLMEWARVAKNWLGIVLPAPEHYGVVGRNHYHVLYQEQWCNLLNVAGWNVLWNELEYGEDNVPWEYWIMAERKR